MFPTNPEEFDADDRISFSKVSNTFLLETEDGREFQWDNALRRWAENVDDDEVARQQQAYAVQGVDEAEPAMSSRNKRKQTMDDHFEEGRQSPAAKKPRKPPQSDTAAPPKERKNTAVYVTNLPSNTDIEEVQRVFSRCGVIAEEIDSGKPRIKLYTDDQGNFKGDALVVYFRPESVDLAIQLLDDTDFRFGEGLPAGKMSVVIADRSYKRQNNDDEKNGADSAESKAAEAKNRKEREKTKKKVIARTQKLNARLADWDDDDPSALPETSSRFDKVVILKHMFTSQELEEDPAAMLDIKEDIREECQKLGEVTNVVLYDGETDGVASVRYAVPEAARACVEVMNGRWFSGTQVVAYISTGEKFKKTNKQKAGIEEDELEGADWAAEDIKRAEKFGSWLEENEKEEIVDQEGSAAAKDQVDKPGVLDPEKS